MRGMLLRKGMCTTHANVKRSYLTLGGVCSTHFVISNPMLSCICFWGRWDECSEEGVTSLRLWHMNMFSSEHEVAMEGQNESGRASASSNS